MKNKKLYNYIVNTFGLSKEKIMEEVDSRIENVIDKNVQNKLNSNHIENLILDRVTRVVAEGVPVDSNRFDFWKKDDFNIYLKKTIRKVIEEKFNEEYTLEVKVIRKEKQVIGRSDD